MMTRCRLRVQVAITAIACMLSIHQMHAMPSGPVLSMYESLTVCSTYSGVEPAAVC